jgi:hypothetical protein
MLTARQAIEKACESGRIENFCADYAEPGYDSPKSGILFANWNRSARYDETTREWITTDDTMPRLAEIAEKAGYAIEWSDEWSTCDQCHRAVRTQADCYSWQPSYIIMAGCEIICKECLREDSDLMAEYLESLEGNTQRAVNLQGIDLTEYGYERFNDTSYESGFHPGQSDDPEAIAAQLRAQGHDRFIFEIASVAQFDTHFNVWVAKEETVEA